eukprot:gene3637-3686_t
MRLPERGPAERGPEAEPGNLGTGSASNWASLGHRLLCMTRAKCDEVRIFAHSGRVAARSVGRNVKQPDSRAG